MGFLPRLTQIILISDVFRDAEFILQSMFVDGVMQRLYTKLLADTVSQGQDMHG